MMMRLSLLLLATLGLTAVQAQVPESDFTAVAMDLDTNPADLVQVELPSFCGRNKQEVPSVFYTIQPGDAVRVLTYPPDAMILSSRDAGETLRLLWNLTAVEGANEAGVIVEFPADQLSRIDACCSARAQIKPGFTSISQLKVGTSSSVSADFSDVLTAYGLDISTSAMASVQLSTRGSLTNAVVGTSATLEAVGNLTRLDASTSSIVRLQGIVTNPGVSAMK